MPSSSPHRQRNQGMSASDKVPGAAHRHVGTEEIQTSSSASFTTLVGIPMAVAALLVGILLPLGLNPFSHWAAAATPPVPSSAQVIDQRQFNVLDQVLPPSQANATTLFIWPGVTEESLKAKPFHIYDDEFYEVIGSNPTLTLLAQSDKDPLFHEAVVWYPPTDEVFFVQNAGAAAAGTGLNKSAIIQKISLAQAKAVHNETNAVGRVDVRTVASNPQVVNPNGATYYRGNIIFAGEGQGDSITSALYLMNPQEPYNTTVLVNNFFGRQFSSLNDIVIHPRTKDIYFTDTLYGFLQDFRPTPGLRNQVYRLNEATGALTVVADGFTLPNGVTFSPEGNYAYVTDTGANHGLQGWNYSDPSTLYRFDVKEDGTWDNRKTFAYVSSGVPDGVHCDVRGNVYAGCGDGVHVWNPSGKLIGKIYLGTTSANFQFTGNSMVICAETELYYATFAATGPPIS
ncbi:lactonohydrolase [Apiospora saccharicola]|uniref:Lactonohydrolase n=1 Tax=Apiospora saccharicola TaxID=335842 RepID=A0ABR1TIV7_9PEZI